MYYFIDMINDDEFEMLDVVDDNDVVILQMSKDKVHAGKKFLHREIGIMILDEKGRILLQQRSSKKEFFPGAWTISAVGHVPAGKTPEEGAHKEIKEELGFDTEFTFIEKRKYISGDHVSFGFLFTGVFPNNTEIYICKNEVEQVKFASKSDVEQMKKDGLLDYHTLETLNKFY